MTIDEIVARLGLAPHPQEGGWFVETYRSGVVLPANVLSGGTPRSLSTAIYYLVTPDSFSHLHRLPADEVFHFYLGDPVEMLLLEPAGGGRVVTLGVDLAADMRPQVVVPAGVWQGSRLAPGGRFALLGTTVAPGFDPADYESGDRATLARSWPQHAERIAALTRG